MIDRAAMMAAHRRVRQDLLEQREASGPWIGELAPSALSTATAISALSIVQSQRRLEQVDSSNVGPNEVDDAQLDDLVRRGLNWLAEQQNEDGGWGDTPLSYSNIATTLVTRAAFTLTGVPAAQARLLDRADRYISHAGGIRALKERYGRDRTFAVPILTHCALAGTVPWRQVAPLPFELAVLPQRFYHWMRLPVVSYAIPALVAMGQARFHFRKPLNPVTRWIRKKAIAPSLRVLEQMQPNSGGYLEAIPLTSFVAMSLAAVGQCHHRVVVNAVRFLTDTARDDGSWPIDTNLSTWNTTLAINALIGDGPDAECPDKEYLDEEYLDKESSAELLDWLLGCQHTQVHPYTGAQPGGWGWSDLSGAVPDADDTPGALLALSVLQPARVEDHARIETAALAGVRWLLDLQNRDGGWPTFCRGWGKLPFDRSGTDLTAHAIRALLIWRRLGPDDEIRAALERGWQYLARRQEDDGSWHPLWFGNQDQPNEQNPVYGTAKVLMAYRDGHRLNDTRAIRGRDQLLTFQNLDGGWGGGWAEIEPGERQFRSSIEETSLAIEALLAWYEEPNIRAALDQGLSWLVAETAAGRHGRCTPIGFYFAKLWYHERLYPLSFAASALRRAVRTYYGEPTYRQTKVHSAS